MGLSMLKVGAALSLFGSEFHAARSVFEKARSPNFVIHRRGLA